MRSLRISTYRQLVFNPTVVLGLLAMSSLLILAFPQQTNAANAKDFNPGRIIDDAVFYNGSAMNASQIQNFLNAKNPNCDTNGTQPASDWGRPDITHATLASYIRNGTNGYTKNANFHAPPYTCLKDFKQNTPQMEAASGLCSGLSARTNRTAAQIIDDVAKACGINPQVLIVLLQKEQSLVTDTWPLKNQFNKATGFACPDTAPCDPKYNGYFYQVYHAARQFKVYKAYPTSYNYIAGRTNRIYWHPDLSRCGSSQVYIQNQATAALYVYTPYRPNQAALNNLYGTGNSCSSYGNRNFWRMFTDWFGSTSDPYDYRFETLVGTGGTINTNTNAGQAVKTIAVGNEIYTYYGNKSNNTLNLAKWNGRAWSNTIIDGAGSAVPGAAATVTPEHIEAFIYKGKLQLYYYDASSHTLRHGYFDSKSYFRLETLDGSESAIIKRNLDVGKSIIGFAYREQDIQLYYYDSAHGSLIHTWWNGKTWNSEVMDGSSSYGVIRVNRALGQGLTGFPHGKTGIQLYYHDTVTKDLIHTWWNGKTWNSEVMDGNASYGIFKRDKAVGSEVKSILYNNNIQLFYFDATAGELVHSWWDGSNWHTETFDGSLSSSVLGNEINSGKKISVSVMNGMLFVGYYDDATVFTNGQTSAWRIAYWNGSTWIQSTLDGGSTSKSLSSAAVPLGQLDMTVYENKTMQLFYKGANNGLMHSWIKK